MHQMFVCSKCGRPHTIQEFKDSRFCLNCGKFLSRTYAKMFPVTKQTNSDWPLFPYTPYPQQLEFMKDIKDVVGNKRILVAEACNGFGKTVCALVSILPIGKRVVYATRTHEQVRQVLLEIEHINKYSMSKFRAVHLASRQHLCLNEKCRKLSALEALEACRIFRDEGKCIYNIDIMQLSNFPPVLSIMRLRREGEKRKICPYFLARKASEKSTVIVAPYQYVFNNRIRSMIKLELTDKILIFDEAHNADQICQEVLSDRLSERTLNSAIKELENIDVSSEFIDDLLAYLERLVSEDIIVRPGIKLREDLKEVLKVEKLTSFSDSFSEIVDKIRQYKMGQGDYPICYLNGVLNFLLLVDSSPWNSYVAVYQRSKYGYNLVEYKCLDPSLAMKPVLEASGALIMSGTLSPIQLFTTILGLGDAEKKIYSAIADPENVRTVIDPTVTTRFTERTEDMIYNIGKRLVKLVAKIPNGILIFFTQRGFMLNALEVWSTNKLITGIPGHFFLGNKPVFIEGARATENRRIVEKYKNASKLSDGAVLCGVFRGRNAEGSNFPYEEARGIILVGVPYADYSNPIIKAQINYFNNKKRNLGKEWYIMDAFKAVNQAIGRGVRHRDDWCNFILMDKRYQSHLELLSDWVRLNGVQLIPTDY